MCDICVCMRVCEYMYTMHTTGLQKNGAEAFSPFKWDSAVPSFVEAVVYTTKHVWWYSRIAGSNVTIRHQWENYFLSL